MEPLAKKFKSHQKGLLSARVLSILLSSLLISLISLALSHRVLSISDHSHSDESCAVCVLHGSSATLVSGVDLSLDLIVVPEAPISLVVHQVSSNPSHSEFNPRAPPISLLTC